MQDVITESTASTETSGKLILLPHAPVVTGILGLFMIQPEKVPTTYVKALLVNVTSDTAVDMKHVEVVLDTNSKKGRLDAMNVGLRRLLDPKGDGTRDVHCARFDQTQDGLAEVEDSFASGPYYVFFYKWSETENQPINPMKLMTKYSLWLEAHFLIRGPIVFARASQIQATPSVRTTYQFKDIQDIPRTKGNAKLNEMICKRPNHPLAKVLHHEPDGCDSCGPVDAQRLQWIHTISTALAEDEEIQDPRLPR